VSIYHKPKGVKYHVENSLRGIRAAARATKHVWRRVRGRRRRILVDKWDEIDLDLTMTKDGVLVDNHWDKPYKDGFRGRNLTPRTSIRKSLWADVSTWRTPDNYRIHKMETAITECAKRGIGARIEPKNDKRLENPDVYRPLKRHADAVGCKLRGYSIRTLGGRGAGARRVNAMREAGIPANVIR
jgi:hypothetical protein